MVAMNARGGARSGFISAVDGRTHATEYETAIELRAACAAAVPVTDARPLDVFMVTPGHPLCRPCVAAIEAKLRTAGGCLAN